MQFAQVTDGVVVALSKTQTSQANIPCGDVVVPGWLYNAATQTLTPAPQTPSTTTSLTPAQAATQLAATMIVGGLNITSTSTPALNGNYALGPSSQAAINAVVTYILLNNTFPGGASTLAWADSAGGSHVFPNIALFKAFATAVADFVATVSIYGDSGGKSGAIPANNITII